MNYFHEHKLWQEAYVALMELHDVFETATSPQLLASAGKVTAMIADALSRNDQRKRKEIIAEATGEVAVTRSHLAVAWGRKLVENEAFRSLDNKYAALSQSIQNFL